MESNSAANKKARIWRGGFYGEKSMYFSTMYLQVQKILKKYLHVDSGNATYVQNLKFKYVYLCHI
jgi:hypothetical protein